MRTVDVNVLTQNIREMCIEANHFLSPDMKKAFAMAKQQEKAPLGRQILLPTAAEYGNCRTGYDSNLPGYRDGGGIFGSRTGCTPGGR